ncbi:MAG: ABC transporter permease [Streptosporangiaceae bacterium]
MLLRYLRAELLRLARNRRFVILAVVMPLGFYLLWSSVFGGSGDTDRGMSAQAYLLVAMGAFGAIMASLVSTAVPLATERKNGWLRQLQITPLPTWAVVVTKLLASLVLVLPAILLVALAAAFVEHVSLSAAQWVGVVAALWIGALPFLALGVVIGSAVGPEAAQPLSMLGMFGLCILGGLWTPLQQLPAFFQRLGPALPSNRIGQVGWQIVAGQAPTAADVGVLAAWAVGAAAVAFLVFRYTTRRA